MFLFLFLLQKKYLCAKDSDFYLFYDVCAKYLVLCAKAQHPITITIFLHYEINHSGIDSSSYENLVAAGSEFTEIQNFGVKIRKEENLDDTLKNLGIV